MKNKELRGFSLAELLISLLIISIVLSAAIPTITKKSAKNNEYIWRWTNQNNSAYFGVGANQSAIIGASQMPFKTNKEGASADFLSNFFPAMSTGSESFGNTKFTIDGDKLVLLKRSPADNNKVDNFINSHISFYNLEGDTTSNITYAGRIASDRHNLAFGIGTLQNLDALDSTALTTATDTMHLGYNTAIGHYALFYNTGGQYNTAVGEGTLSQNRNSTNNTAIGYKALNQSNPSKNPVSDEGKEVEAGGNTSIGAFATLKNTDGSNNTAIGMYALSENIEGSFNTAIGANACRNLTGHNNICIGYNAGVIADNVHLVASSASNPNNDNNAFYLGYDELTIPLMYGHTSREKTITNKKDLMVNVDNFQIKTADSEYDPVFNVDITKKAGAAAGTSSQKTTKFDFQLDNADAGILPAKLSFSESQSGDAAITSEDLGGNSRNILFNDSLRIFFPTSTATDRTVKLYVLANKSGTSATNGSNLNFNEKLIVNNGSNATINLFNPLAGNNAFSVNISPDGVTSRAYFNMTNAGGFDINAGDNFTVNSSKNVDLKGNTIKIQSDYIQMGKNNNVVFENNDLKISTITTYNSFVGANITGLWSKINDLYGELSDARLKNIKGDNTSGLKEINMLEVKNFTFKDDKEKKPHVGVIAQQLQKVFPNSVFKNKDGYLKITKDEIFYAMVNAIKEISVKIQDLTAKITGLDKRLTELEKQNALLKKQNEEFEKRLSKLEKSIK